MANAVLEQLAKHLETKLKEALTAKKYVDTGNLLNSIHVDVVESNRSYALVGYHADYGYFAEKGRKPGTWPARGVIESWMSRKGIGNDLTDSGKKGLAYIIRRKIKEKGIPGTYSKEWSIGNTLKRPNYISDVLTKEEQYMRNEVQKAFATEFDIMISEITQKFK